MSADEKNRREDLSRIVADLFVKSQGDEELSSKIQRLRGELKKVIESGDTIFGKFRELVASFEEIIPEEKQRYHAAIKALSTTSKLSREEIVKAVGNQLEELNILKKGLLSAHPDWRDELKVMEARSREMRDEIAKLREKIGQLESEEKEILNGIATREKEVELVEKAVGELFTDIGSEVTYIKKRIEEFTAEPAAAQPVAPRDFVKSDIPRESAAAQPIPPGASMKSDIPAEKKEDGERKSEIVEPSAPQYTEFQKKCPMCGGRMDFYGSEERWQCYVCAYEELTKDEVQDTSKEKDEQTNAPESSPHLSVPLAPLFPDEFPKAKKGALPSDDQPSGKKKACPVCRKNMDWYQVEKAWRCHFCGYERSI